MRADVNPLTAQLSLFPAATLRHRWVAADAGSPSRDPWPLQNVSKLTIQFPAKSNCICHWTGSRSVLSLINAHGQSFAQPTLKQLDCPVQKARFSILQREQTCFQCKLCKRVNYNIIGFQRPSKFCFFFNEAL